IAFSSIVICLAHPLAAPARSWDLPRHPRWPVAHARHRSEDTTPSTRRERSAGVVTTRSWTQELRGQQTARLMGRQSRVQARATCELLIQRFCAKITRFRKYGALILRVAHNIRFSPRNTVACVTDFSVTACWLG